MWKQATMNAVLVLALFGIHQNGGLAGDAQDPATRTAVQFSTALDGSVEETALLALEREGALDRCKKAVILELHKGCAELTEEETSRLALRLLNCQRQHEGRSVFPCSEAASLSECTSDMPESVWNSYLELHSMAKATCMHLAQSIWRQQSEGVVDRLTTAAHTSLKTMQEMQKEHMALQNAASTALERMTQSQAHLMEGQQQMQTALESMATSVDSKLDRSLEKEDSLLQGQIQALDNQRKLLHEGQELQASLQRARLSLNEVQDEMLAQRAEYQEAFADVFQALQSIRAFVQFSAEQFSNINNSVFYVFALIVGYLLTTTQQTRGARVWVMAIMTLSLVFERILIAFFLSGDGPSDRFEQIRWNFRKTFLSISIAAIVVKALRYRDIATDTARRLAEVDETSRTILGLLQSMTGTSPGSEENEQANLDSVVNEDLPSEAEESDVDPEYKPDEEDDSRNHTSDDDWEYMSDDGSASDVDDDDSERNSTHGEDEIQGLLEDSLVMQSPKGDHRGCGSDYHLRPRPSRSLHSIPEETLEHFLLACKIWSSYLRRNADE